MLQMLHRVKVDLFPEQRSKTRAAALALSGTGALHVQ